MKECSWLYSCLAVARIALMWVMLEAPSKYLKHVAVAFHCRLQQRARATAQQHSPDCVARRLEAVLYSTCVCPQEAILLRRDAWPELQHACAQLQAYTG